MRVHFISIGGSVMHQLAIALHRKGYRVSGTDDEIFEPAHSQLQKEGLLPDRMGWQPDLITSDIDAIILGMHARKDNPELQKAEALGLPIFSFPAYIYHESRQKTRVVVGGSHGKTTTTSMIMHVLKKAGRDFDFLVGARLTGFDQSVRLSDAPVIVCEGDEYPASALQPQPKFHFLYPHLAILTGIAWDHINVFPSFEGYLEQFRIFIEKIEPGGLLVYNETDQVLTELVQQSRRTDIRYRPYGLPAHIIENGHTWIELEGVKTQLQVFGNHNLLNLHAAWYICCELGVTAEQFVEAIADFRGAAKRLELVAQNRHISIYRDFAHAPSKVKATLDAVRQQYPLRRLIGILELHTYSSLNAAFMPEYKGAMDAADDAVVFYSHHAMAIKRMPELPETIVQDGFAKKGLVILHTATELRAWLARQDISDANLIFMSSGNYDGFDMLTFADTITQSETKNHS
jgi:UDP-N-acetylmuramate: L-alanyl-gamma-D-glutamyl-meso-diaminopimelate ligase